MRWWGLESEQQSAAESYREGKEWWHSAFPAFGFELHASAASAFHNCCALEQKFYQENTLSVPEYGAHVLPCWNRLLELFPFRWASTLPVQGLLFWFRCDIGHPCLISCHNMAQYAVSFLVIAHQKCQSTCNTLFLCSSVSILGTHHAHTFR